MINIYLDDFRFPGQSFNYTKDIRYNILDWEIVRNYKEFKDLISEIPLSEIEIVSFDHDLGDYDYNHIDIHDYEISRMNNYEKTGYDCLKWLCAYYLDKKEKLPKILFHTNNSVGRENMRIYLKNFKKHNPELV